MQSESLTKCPHSSVAWGGPPPSPSICNIAYFSVVCCWGLPWWPCCRRRRCYCRCRYRWCCSYCYRCRKALRSYLWFPGCAECSRLAIWSEAGCVLVWLAGLRSSSASQVTLALLILLAPSVKRWDLPTGSKHDLALSSLNPCANLVEPVGQSPLVSGSTGRRPCWHEGWEELGRYRRARIVTRSAGWGPSVSVALANSKSLNRAPQIHQVHHHPAIGALLERFEYLALGHLRASWFLRRSPA